MSAAPVLAGAGPGDLIARMLLEQQSLTAVERFAQRHADVERRLQDRRYRDLMPLEGPGPGQQYAFEVDLDKCSGCKACVTGCHNLNGLDDGEIWRKVGLLHGGTGATSVQQTVTTSCHHCLDPACLTGCPVDAYEKDPRTGIVHHLDDQCIGCRYCTLTCPYEVPRFNAAKGIVRKCDMCADRLAVDEAPACVQSCPTEAIAIRVVDEVQVLARQEAAPLVPGAPSSQLTLPTTRYKSARPFPQDTLPADYYRVRREAAHPPLTWMLVLTQLSAGAFVVEQVLPASRARPVQTLVALVLGLLALGASVLHLGRPHLAWKAFLGLRHSWLSREIVAFGGFAAAAALHAAALWTGHDGAAITGPLAAATGVAGVLASVLVYTSTRRPLWTPLRVGSAFLGTTALLGLAAALAVTLLAGAEPPKEAWLALVFVSGAKLISEAAPLLHHRDRRQTALKRSAVLQLGELRHWTATRFALGALGGVLLPLVALSGVVGPAPSALAAVALALVLGGELIERHVFFVAGVAPRMPGTPA